MPHSVKSIILESLVIVMTMSAIGHLGVHFWERFLLQHELAQMKQSLHFLKATLTKVGNAYDTLHTEIIGLSDFTTKKNLVYNTFFGTPGINALENIAVDEITSTLDRRRPHDVHVNTMINAKSEVHNFPAHNEPLDLISTAKTKNEAANFLLREQVKNEAVNFPEKIHANNEAMEALKASVKNKALNFPLKSDANSQAPNVPLKSDAKSGANSPLNADAENHNSALKANKTAGKEFPNTKTTTVSPSHVKFTKDKNVITRCPLKSTEAGDSYDGQLDCKQANTDYHGCLKEFINCKSQHNSHQNSKA